MPPAPLSLRQLRRAKRYWSRHLLDRANVVGVGIGAELTGDRATGRTALRVYVERKRREAALAERDRLPAALGLPRARCEGFFAGRDVPVDVIEIGRVRGRGSGRVRPLVMGYDCSRRPPSRTSLGTMSAVVEDQHGRRFLLGNNHVLADLDAGRPGDDAILQPAGAAEAEVAVLDRYVPIDPVYENRVDAAIAHLREGLDQGTVVEDIGPIESMLPAAPHRDTIVHLSGAGSSPPRLSGQVIDRDWDGFIDYGSISARFVDLFVLGVPTRDGDSGALVVTTGGHAAGLVVGGSPTVTVCCSLRAALAELGDPVVAGGGQLDLRLV